MLTWLSNLFRDDENISLEATTLYLQERLDSGSAELAVEAYHISDDRGP
jgi:hypothetical protein